MEDNTCPKPTCGKPESTHRFSRGKRLSICADGHDWNAQEVAEQRAKAEEAKAQEETAVALGSQMERFRQILGNPHLPDLKSFA